MCVFLRLLRQESFLLSCITDARAASGFDFGFGKAEIELAGFFSGESGNKI